jgi:hypothetical protein
LKPLKKSQKIWLEPMDSIPTHLRHFSAIKSTNSRVQLFFDRKLIGKGCSYEKRK